MMQWLEGGGEAGADAQDMQLQQHSVYQVGSSFVSPEVPEAAHPLPSSRSALHGSLRIDEGNEQQQQLQTAALTSPLERHERDLQAEALKVPP